MGRGPAGEADSRALAPCSWGRPSLAGRIVYPGEKPSQRPAGPHPTRLRLKERLRIRELTPEAWLEPFGSMDVDLMKQAPCREEGKVEGSPFWE